VDHRRFVHSSLGIAAALALGASTLLTGAMPAVAHGGTQHPVTINNGTCELLGEVAIPLGDAGDQLPVDGEPAASDPRGAESAVQVDGSQTNVQLALSDLLGGPYAIAVHASADEMDTVVACGDIGGRMMGQSELPVGIAEVDGSGTNGIAILEDNGDGTTEVSVYVIKAESADDHSHDDDHGDDDHDHEATPGA
jgi:hypothetical protein